MVHGAETHCSVKAPHLVHLAADIAFRELKHEKVDEVDWCFLGVFHFHFAFVENADNPIKVVVGANSQEGALEIESCSKDLQLSRWIRSLKRPRVIHRFQERLVPILILNDVAR